MVSFHVKNDRLYGSKENTGALRFHERGKLLFFSSLNLDELDFNQFMLCFTCNSYILNMDDSHRLT